MDQAHSARHSRRKALRIAAAFLVVGLSASALAVWAVIVSTHRIRDQELTSLATAARTAIERRIVSSTDALYGLRGLFATGPRSRKRFHDFLSLVNVPGHIPGALTFAFVARIPQTDILPFERSVRAENGPRALQAFTVHPRGRTGDHLIVDFLEPLAGNEQAFGFNVASEPGRRAALEGARDSGDVAATVPLRLVQQIGGRKGFIVFLAIYDTEDVPQTVPARRRHFVGLVDAVFDVEKLLDGVLGPEPRVRINQIFDVGPTTASREDSFNSDRLLINWGNEVSALSPDTLRTAYRLIDLNVGDRRWRMLVTPTARLRSGFDRFPPLFVGGAGIAFSLLAAGITLSLGSARARALTLAAQMTIDLRKRDAQLEGRDRAMRDFLAVTSHDMRTSLTVIGGFSRTLIDNWTRAPDHSKIEQIKIIERRSEQLVILVNDLLLSSEIDGGVLKPRPDRFEVRNALLNDLRLLGERGAAVAVNCPADMTAYADQAHFSRIVTNLLENAFKYGAAPVAVDAHVNNGSIEIRVSDNGVGIPDSFAPKLFQKFARAEPAPGKPRPNGSGLGLSIVRGLAQANDGDVDYEPKKPHGSCFVVRLPMVPA